MLTGPPTAQLTYLFSPVAADPQGLRQRNWTDRRRFDAKSEPWRLQLFRCGYSTDPTGWAGFRAVVTTSSSAADAASTSSTSSSSSDGGTRRRWVSMPDPGPVASLDSRDVAEPTRVGYNDVLVQLYQAYTQVLPREARKQLEKQGYVPAGQFKYRCPGEKLIEVSYHWAAAQTRPALVGGGGGGCAEFGRGGGVDSRLGVPKSEGMSLSCPVTKGCLCLCPKLRETTCSPLQCSLPASSSPHSSGELAAQPAALPRHQVGLRRHGALRHPRAQGAARARVVPGRPRPAAPRAQHRPQQRWPDVLPHLPHAGYRGSR